MNDSTIWERPEQGDRGPRRAHSRERIAVTAVAIADAEGIESVSMRRVAREFRTGAASLYRYVDKKDELFDLMLDAVLGEEWLTPHTGDWRRDLREIAYRARRLILRHPWAAALTAGRPILGPNSLHSTEHALAALDGLPLDANQSMLVIETLLAFVRGHTMKEVAESEAVRRSGQDFAQYIQGQARYAETVVASGLYPRLTRYWVEATTPHAPDRENLAFEQGLSSVINGFATLLPQQ
ncbi:TetR/AcrR family transcriptional regulator [Kutzneria sp. CA-103260]|uniref:TetR/AcrR family transcriptional regulator n=1 Tax=Kutzneria sp. CA-103260 TaxID=2802641 RepID=UPI001BA7DB15|nr:TetR/AcrR family transcriptional regulator [Kutzneria sp. CA-103260]QUQ71811.1 TetR family transcriptional regulator [Kutzneria sp. CA-103260]